MTQGGLIAGALLLAWIMYLAIQNRLGKYLAIFVGGAASAAPAGGSPTEPPAPGSVGADPNFQPSPFAPGSAFDRWFGTNRQPLNPPT